MDNADTLGVLRQLERGEISADEADARLNAPPPMIEYDAAPHFDETEIPLWMRRIWVYPLIAGVLVVFFGAWIIATTVHANILWLVLGLPILLAGALLLALAASAHSEHWLYVNIENARKRRRAIRFGIPFPLGLVRLGLWFARFAMPRPRRAKVSTARMKFDAFWENPDDLFNALESELRSGRGMTVDVEDKGERVQVYIV
jgi:hypothetical protein